jgi:hypothetical protein
MCLEYVYVPVAVVIISFYVRFVKKPKRVPRQHLFFFYKRLAPNAEKNRAAVIQYTLFKVFTSNENKEWTSRFLFTWFTAGTSSRCDPGKLA